jgi:hypothetical protein
LDSFPIRSSAGADPDPERIETAARILGRAPFYKDGDGCEYEIIGAAISETGLLAYLESQTKDGGANPHGFGGRHIDVSIRIHLFGSEGTNHSVEIESYNPFFGCDVRFFEWIGETVVLIYREKHWTFAYRFGDVWPPKFLKIEDDWLIHDNQLVHIGYKERSVRRLSFPALDYLDPLPKEEGCQAQPNARDLLDIILKFRFGEARNEAHAGCFCRLRPRSHRAGI